MGTFVFVFFTFSNTTGPWETSIRALQPNIHCPILELHPVIQTALHFQKRRLVSKLQKHSARFQKVLDVFFLKVTLLTTSRADEKSRTRYEVEGRKIKQAWDPAPFPSRPSKCTKCVWNWQGKKWLVFLRYLIFFIDFSAMLKTVHWNVCCPRSVDTCSLFSADANSFSLKCNQWWGK